MGYAVPGAPQIHPSEGTRPLNKPLSVSAGQEGGHILHPRQNSFCCIYHTLLANMTQSEQYSLTGNWVSVGFQGVGVVRIPLISHT